MDAISGRQVKQVPLIIIEDILRVMHGRFEGVSITQPLAASEALQ